MTNRTIIIVSGISVVFAILLLMAGMPRYSVWQQEMSGKAELAKAEQNRQIKIQEAKAAKESAAYFADAEVIRAKGVARANKIIAGGLKGNDEYLRYLWINAMGDKNDKATIYVPVGNDGLPIMKSVR